MEEVALKELDSRLHKQVETVRKALNKNPSYSVDVMTMLAIFRNEFVLKLECSELCERSVAGCGGDGSSSHGHGQAQVNKPLLCNREEKYGCTMCRPTQSMCGKQN